MQLDGKEKVYGSIPERGHVLPAHGDVAVLGRVDLERVNTRAGRNGISRRGYEVEHRSFLRLRKASGAGSAAARSIFTIVQPNGR